MSERGSPSSSSYIWIIQKLIEQTLFLLLYIIYIYIYIYSWEGYNATQFVGLVLFTFLTPLSFTLIFTTLQLHTRLSAQHVNELGRSRLICANALTMVVLAAVTGVGVWGSYHLMQCMAVVTHIKTLVCFVSS